MIKSFNNPWEWSKIGQGWPRTKWLRIVRPLGEYFTPGLGHHKNTLYVIANMWRQWNTIWNNFLCDLLGHKLFLHYDGQKGCQRCNWTPFYK